MKFSPVRIEREPGDEDADAPSGRPSRWRRPSSTACRTSSPCRRRRGRRRQSASSAADDVEVPGEQVHPREREVLRADHQRDEEVPEHRRDRRDHEEEDHHHAVHREELVVGLGLQDVARGRQQLEPDQRREQAAEREEERDADQVEDRDALVVRREQPRLHAVAGVQVVRRAALGGRRVGVAAAWCSWLRAASCSGGRRLARRPDAAGSAAGAGGRRGAGT